MSTPLELSDLQRLAILYRLGQLTNVEAGSDPLTSQRAEVGLAWLKCEECDEEQDRADRGCWRFGNRLKARAPWAIDYTGHAPHDKIAFCPRSLIEEDLSPPGRVTSVSLVAALGKVRQMKACGGLAAYHGQAPADSPPRVAWLYAQAEGVVGRYQAEVKDTQASLQAAVLATLQRRKTPED